MKFDDLEKRMRVFETSHDHRVLPGTFMVARIDGRSFTRLTREVHRFDAPYDVRVRDLMIATTRHLMTECGFETIYGYTQSDEISILFARGIATFGRKLRKFDSVLAGEASAKFTHLLGDLAAFDARISQLPRESDVVDYFRWRHQDAHRNALHGHCYWLLRGRGKNEREATVELDGKSVSWRNELLFQNGITFDALPTWQKRGAGLWFRDEEREGVDPRTGASTRVTRRALHVELELPMGDAYSELVRARIAEADPPPRVR